MSPFKGHSSGWTKAWTIFVIMVVCDFGKKKKYLHTSLIIIYYNYDVFILNERGDKLIAIGIRASTARRD